MVPEVKDGQVTGITLLHASFVPLLGAEVTRRSRAYQGQYTALVDAVTEDQPRFEDAVLGQVAPIELLTEPVAVLASHWSATSIYEPAHGPGAGSAVAPALGLGVAVEDAGRAADRLPVEACTVGWPPERARLRSAQRYRRKRDLCTHAAEMAGVDGQAAEPVDVLVGRAGAAVARRADARTERRLRQGHRRGCRKGNNGADGRSAASLLSANGARVGVTRPADLAGARRSRPRRSSSAAAYGTGLQRAYSAPDPGRVPVLAVDIVELSGLTGRLPTGSGHADGCIDLRLFEARPAAQGGGGRPCLCRRCRASGHQAQPARGRSNKLLVVETPRSSSISSPPPAPGVAQVASCRSDSGEFPRRRAPPGLASHGALWWSRLRPPLDARR